VDAQRGAIEVKFALEQQAPAYLREDMTLSVEVETARRDRALVLPLSSVRSQVSDSSVTVWVAQDGRAQERAVKLGLRTLDAAEALEGLTEGEVVLLGGNVKAGARVRPQPVVWQPGKSAASGASKQDAGSALTNAMGR
jgi:HlyD family secretion protein